MLKGIFSLTPKQADTLLDALKEHFPALRPLKSVDIKALNVELAGVYEAPIAGPFDIDLQFVKDPGSG